MKQKNKNNAGFSLIELLFAMTFLTVIVFGVIKLQLSNLTLSNTKQLEISAHFMSAQALEIIEAITTDDSAYDAFLLLTCELDSECSLNGYVISTDYSEDVNGDEVFGRSITHDITGLTDATLVTVKVEWTDTSGLHKVEAKKIIIDPNPLT